jgi:hypothetical protein
MKALRAREAIRLPIVCILLGRYAIAVLTWLQELANGIAEMPDLANSLSVEEVYELRNKADSNRIDRTEFGHLLEKLVEKSGDLFCPEIVFLNATCHFKKPRWKNPAGRQ